MLGIKNRRNKMQHVKLTGDKKYNLARIDKDHLRSYE